MFREIKTTTDGETFGGTSASTFRGAIFILIESGMTLFSIQLARLLVTSLSVIRAYQFVIPLHEMINVIMISVTVTCKVLLTTWAYLGYYAHNHPGAGINGTVFPQREFHGG